METLCIRWQRCSDPVRLRVLWPRQRPFSRHSQEARGPPGAAPNLGWPGSRRWPRWREAVVRGCVCGSVVPGAGPRAPMAVSSRLPDGAEASDEARQLLWGPLPFSWGAWPGLSALPRSPLHPEPPASGRRVGLARCLPWSPGKEGPARGAELSAGSGPRPLCGTGHVFCDSSFVSTWNPYRRSSAYMCDFARNSVQCSKYKREISSYLC